MATYDKNRPEDVDTTQEDHLCLVGETLITMKDGYKLLQDVVVGDYVKTTDGYKKVIASEYTGEKECISVIFSNATRLMGTADHPVFTTEGKIPLGSLDKNNIVISDSISKGNYAVGSKPIGIQKVYNITVEGNHQYFANGILVSNCDTLRYLLMARIFRPQLEAKKKKPEAWADVQEEENSWMGL